ncbi:MAG: plasmid mobilization relaxosome protein MobC [Sphingobacteriales bacterium]|nr:plasmid mobilization relaxosome protein MobC [Sphingobacteriales bacterium]OJW00283.1 MAG: hypothetical protein BGO52_04145 [Sphingobacteriales bacterium 44-61]
MGRKKMKEDNVLKYRIETRVNFRKYQELQHLLKNTINKDMSSLVRDILHNRPIKIYQYDHSLDITMEELAALRAEIRAIGVNINQITKLFNTYPEWQRKQFYGKTAFAEYIRTEAKIEQVLLIITKLSRKWLSA